MRNSQLTRKDFLKQTLLAITGATLSMKVLASVKEDVSVGVCTSWENSTLAKQAGCSFIEEGVGKILMPDKPVDLFNQQLISLTQSQPLGVRSFIYFLPGEMKVVGPNVNHEAIITYASVAFERAKKVGAKTVVFGSGKAREIPSGFEKSMAREQMISLCKLLAPAAARHNIILAVEQLNRSETNFLNLMEETGDIVTNVGHPNFQMVCDIYHALRENDDPQQIIKFKKHIVHCHIAEKEERTPPGTKGDDFTPYFRALKKIKYKGGLSLECRFKNMEDEIGKAVKVVQEQYRKA